MREGVAGRAVGGRAGERGCAPQASSLTLGQQQLQISSYFHPLAMQGKALKNEVFEESA